MHTSRIVETNKQKARASRAPPSNLPSHKSGHEQWRSGDEGTKPREAGKFARERYALRGANVHQYIDKLDQLREAMIHLRQFWPLVAISPNDATAHSAVLIFYTHPTTVKPV
eukprot:scaffold7759_cov119-Isochrysis_galbana.AAC.6